MIYIIYHVYLLLFPLNYANIQSYGTIGLLRISAIEFLNCEMEQNDKYWKKNHLFGREQSQ